MIPPHSGPHGVRSADRGRRGPFASLVAQAAQDPDAAAALASCHAELPPDARRALIEAVCTDARAAGHDPAPALLALLAVEDDLPNAQRLRTLLENLAEPTQLNSAEARAWLGIHGNGGRAVLAEPLHGPFFELVALGWDDGRVTRCSFEPMAREDDLPPWIRPWGLDPDRHAADFAAVVETLVEVLWNHRRHHGPLPPALSRLAHLL